VNIHQTALFKENFNPEAFAEESLSSYLAVELISMNINNTSCEINFDITIPVHLRYRARLLSSTLSQRGDGITKKQFRRGDGDEGIVTTIDDDRATHTWLDSEEELLHSLLGVVKDRGMGRKSGSGEGGMHASSKTERQLLFSDVVGDHHVVSLIPPPLVAVGRSLTDESQQSPHSTTQSAFYSRTVVLASSKCIPCLARARAGDGATSASVTVSCSRADFSGDCTPSLQVLMPVALQAHVVIVLWTTAVVLLCTTYLLSWLLLHPKKRGGGSGGVGPPHQSLD
jgi:hypothetical protein